MNELLITLCFYEIPGALHNIKIWEKLKYDNIICKQKYDDQILFFLKKQIDIEKTIYELVFCFPDYTHDFDALKYVKLKFKELNIDVEISEENIKYYKTLLFGKFDLYKLENIMNIIKRYEK